MEPLASREEFWPPDLDPAPPPQPVGYLEILGRSGRVHQRVAVTDRPLRLGRACDNDIVLDDPYTCPHHAEISAAEGGLLCLDLGSVNGFRFAAGQRQERAVLGSGESLRIGRTTLRFRAKDHPLPPSLVDHFASSPLLLFERPFPLLALFAAAVGYLLLNSYLAEAEKIRGVALAREMVGPLLVILAWAMPWALVSRIAKSRWYYFAHCGIASAGLVSMGLLTMITGYACFAFGADPLRPVLAAAGDLLLVALMIFIHLHFASSATPRRLAGAAVLVSASLVGLVFLTQEVGDDDFDSSPSFKSTLKPPAFRLAPGQTTDRFFGDAEEMREKIEKELEKKD